MRATPILVTAIVAAALLTSCGQRKTTAERLVELLNSGNSYPTCSAEGCIKEITAKGNTVIAIYVVPQRSKDFPDSTFVNRAETAANLKVDALRDFCGALQKDFPDTTMQWAGHYYTQDDKFLASVLMRVSECPSFN
jgi:hypothetical protein